MRKVKPEYLKILPQKELVANLREYLEEFNYRFKVSLLKQHITAMNALIFNYENKRQASCPLCAVCLACSHCPWYVVNRIISCVAQTTIINLGYTKDRVRQLRAWVRAYERVLMEVKLEKS